MSNDYDFLNIFPEEKSNQTASGDEDLYREFQKESSRYGTNSAPSPEPLSMDDYKYASHVQKSGSGEHREVRSPRPENSSKKLNITEDKVVWAGALFVFFGVFLLLIGYWLGKAGISDVNESGEETLAMVRENLEEAELETALSGLDLSSSDTGVIALSDNGTSAISTPIPEEEEVVTAPAIEDITAPAITVAKATTTTTTTTTVKAEETSTESDVTGDFTIQVSAHTSMDSARLVESELRDMGYQSYVVESIVGGVRYYRVRVGSFTSKNDAKAAVSELNATELGADAYLITL